MVKRDVLHVFVAGGTGVLGRALVPQLVARGGTAPGIGLDLILGHGGTLPRFLPPVPGRAASYLQYRVAFAEGNRPGAVS